MKNKKLSAMQAIVLTLINAETQAINPAYLAVKYYESIGRRRFSISRNSFGQTSAAYRACRKLAELGLIKKHVSTENGWCCETYSKI